MLRFAITSIQQRTRTLMLLLLIFLSLLSSPFFDAAIAAILFRRYSAAFRFDISPDADVAASLFSSHAFSPLSRQLFFFSPLFS